MALYSNYYGRWLTGIDAWLSPGRPQTPGDRMREPLATCENCLMADAPRLKQVMSEHFTTEPLAKRDPGPFKQDLKCCTYQPYLPNFVVGELLAIESPRMIKSFDFWLQSGALQPQGLVLGAEISPDELAEGFGVDESLLCPFLDRAAQACTIWANRPAVCSSYQCVSRYGARGQEFWNELETLLNLFEWTLAHEVLWRMGWTQDDLEVSQEIAVEFTDRSVFLEDAGREREFYLKARDLAHQISSDEVIELLGESATEAKQTLVGLYNGLVARV